MASPLTLARRALAAQLADIPGAYVYDGVPEVVTLPALIISADKETWIRPMLNHGADVRLSIHIAVSRDAGNAPALERLEEITWEVLKRIRALDILAPATQKLGNSETFVTDITTVIRVKE